MASPDHAQLLALKAHIASLESELAKLQKAQKDMRVEFDDLGSAFKLNCTRVWDEMTEVDRRLMRLLKAVFPGIGEDFASITSVFKNRGKPEDNARS